MTPSHPITPHSGTSIGSAPISAFAIPGLVHGFGSRAGGVSEGAFATFNLADWIGDNPESVVENWRRWNASYPGLPVARVSQVHGPLVHRIDEPKDALREDGRRREGDGMVTAAAGLVLGIFTADCVPILMVDNARHVVAALHAGWRGTLSGIAAEGVRAMVALGARPTAIHAALGPSIGICCFEVDAALAEDFARRIPGADGHTRMGQPGKAYLDLRALIRDQLEHEGLVAASIANVGPCTRCANDTYFSRRGAVGATSGLQMSFIGFTG
ncbi:MAG TPA: peptidoglycan editing factor PgeF [Candidatus Binataceae bacterium]|jgi:polyphenol oxidase